jgi:transcriptional regulator with XRE-family HTH domain
MEKPEKISFLRQLGAHISKLRKAKGVGQDKLTEKAGLAKGMVSKIESGSVDPRTTTLVRLARGLGVPFVRFFDIRS